MHSLNALLCYCSQSQRVIEVFSVRTILDSHPFGLRSVAPKVPTRGERAKMSATIRGKARLINARAQSLFQPPGFLAFAYSSVLLKILD